MEITLDHGYTDPASSENWNTVTVRCPKFDDEIKAQEACGQSVAPSLFIAHFLNLCCTQFGPKPGAPGVHIIRSLHRDDVYKIQAAVNELEYGTAEGNAD